MNDMELEHLEAELRRVAPARPPEDFMARLKAAQPAARAARTELPVRVRYSAGFDLSAWLMRWLVPATALVIGMLVVWRVNLPGTVGPKNWSCVLPLTLEEMLALPLNASIRGLHEGAGRV